MTDRVLNDRELAQELDPTGKIVTTWTIRNWRLQGDLPHFRVGHRIFFRLGSVLQWVAAREQQQGREPEPEQYGVLRKIK